VQPIQFPGNVELVKKYYDVIDMTMIDAVDGESPAESNVVRTVGE
jgi:hypothetical protein